MAIVNITTYNDADFYRTFLWQTLAGAPIDLTGGTMEMMLRRHAQDQVAEMRLATDTGEIVFTDPVNGQFTVRISQYFLERLALGSFDQSNIFTRNGYKVRVWSGALTNNPGGDAMSEVEVANDIDTGVAISDSTVVVLLDSDTEIIQTFEQGPPGPQGPPGEHGTSGNTVLYGAADPTYQGVSGDFYINTTTHFIFGPKATTGWPAGTSLIGPQGIQGVPGNTVLYGAVDPGAGVGVDGNFYINTTTHFIFGPKAGGAWPAGTSMIGPQGPAGGAGAPGPAGAQVIVSDTPPAGAPDGAIWYESDTGLTYFKYNDGSSSQWVVLIAGSSAGNVRYDAPQTLTSQQRVQARSNIYAAPFDAMAFNGIQINGAMDVFQFGVNSTLYPGGGGAYIVDEWLAGASRTGGGALGVGQFGNGPPGFPNTMVLQTTTAIPAGFAASDYVLAQHRIEGLRCRRLNWGTANAQPVMVSFWMLNFKTGTATLSVRSAVSGAGRTYLKDFVYPSNVWTYYSFLIPGDTAANSWATDNTPGMIATLCFGAGSTYQGIDGVWQTGSWMATAATSQTYFTNVGDTLYITGLTVHPGNEAPSSDRSSFVQRHADQELMLCKRHFQIRRGGGNSFLGTMMAYAPNSALGKIWSFDTEMRAAPTVTVSAMADIGMLNAGATFLPATALNNLQGFSDGVLANLTVAGTPFGALSATLAQLASGGWLKAEARL